MISYSLFTPLLYASGGILSGLLSGLFGIGGGVVTVPFLLFIFQYLIHIPEQYTMQMASATSLAIMLLTSQASVRVHYKLHGILLPVYKRLLPGILLGTLIGIYLAGQLSSHFLQVFFGLFLLLQALRMLATISTIKSERFPPAWVNNLISFFIGMNSGLLGIGGGTLIIPYLNYCGVNSRNIAGISALCTLSMASIGVIMLILTKNSASLPDLEYATGYIYWPAVLFLSIPSIIFVPWGAKLTVIISQRRLNYGFIFILTLTGLHLLF